MKLRSAIGKAPGRLDLMGGVADYSGALVLQTPIQTHTRVRVEEVEGDHLNFSSRWYGAWEWSVQGLKKDLERTPAEMRKQLQYYEVPDWARYLYGCLWTLCRAKGVLPRTGLEVEAMESVPQGAGVSSSAALEIATLRGLASVMKVRFKGSEIAHLGQQAENQIVGAPCGLMDQLASAFGQKGKILPILCRPDYMHKPIDFPRGMTAVGWSSRLSHSVADSPYAVARAATFMGKRILEELWGARIPYATSVAPSSLRRAEPYIPETLTGQKFKRDYGVMDDPLSTVKARQRYPVRAALRFASEEDHRSRLAKALLSAEGPGLDDRMEEVGELMFQSHEGYREIGLGHERTDDMVEQIRALGVASGFYGARTSGGGLGGTVVVLMRKSSMFLVRKFMHHSDTIPTVT